MSRALARILVLSLLFSASAGASLAHAQTLPGLDPLTFTVEPQYPKPYDVVTISIDSTLLDLAASTLHATVNGKSVEVNGRTISFALGGPGTRSTVAVSAIASDGTESDARVVLTPEDVSLIEEPNSTVPLFYKGAALPAPEGRVRLVALANLVNSSGARLNPANLVYTWKLGDQNLNTVSGIGKNVLSATAPVLYRDANVSVLVSTPDNAYVGSANIVVSPVSPYVRLYQHDPLGGVDLAHAQSGTYTMRGAEETLRAVSYYFTQMPSFSWSVGNVASGNGEDLTLRSTGTSVGTSQLSLSAVNGTQTAGAGLLVQFGSTTASTLFGL